VLGILGVCIPTSQESCPYPPVTGIRPRWWIALLQSAHRSPPGDDRTPGGWATKHHSHPTRAPRACGHHQAGSSASQEEPIVAVAQPTGTTPRQIERTARGEGGARGL